MFRVLEMMVLEVGQRVGHVGFARQERALEDDSAAPADSTHTPHVARDRTDQQFRPVAALTQLRVRQQQIVPPLDDVIRELIGERKPDARRPAFVVDDVDSSELRLFPAVLGEPGHRQRLLGRHHEPAIAFVEPLRGLTDLAWRRTSSVEPETEHLHRVGQGVFGRSGRPMHAVSRVGATQMRQPRAGDVQPQRVWMVQRHEDATVLHDRPEICPEAAHAGADDRLQRGSRANRRQRQVVDAFDPVNELERPAVRGGHADSAASGFIGELDQPDGHAPWIVHPERSEWLGRPRLTTISRAARGRSLYGPGHGSIMNRRGPR